MLDVATKIGVVMLGVPIIGQAATNDYGIWSDYKTWIGALALMLFTQGDKIFTGMRTRWERRSLSDEQIKVKEVERNITETERLQAKVDELVRAQLLDKDKELQRLREENKEDLARLRKELADSNTEKDRLRELFLTKGENNGP